MLGHQAWAQAQDLVCDGWWLRREGAPPGWPLDSGISEGGSVLLDQGETVRRRLVWDRVLLTPEGLDLIAPLPGVLNPLPWSPSPCPPPRRFHGKHVVSRERSILLPPRFPGHTGRPPAAQRQHHRLCEHVGRVLGQPPLQGTGLQEPDPSPHSRLSLPQHLPPWTLKSLGEETLELGMGIC